MKIDKGGIYKTDESTTLNTKEANTTKSTTKKERLKTEVIDNQGTTFSSTTAIQQPTIYSIWKT